METILHHNIQRSLTFHLYQNAIFLSERLFAQQPTFFNMFNVANSYYLSQQINTTYHFLKHHSTSWKIYSLSTSTTTSLSPQDVQVMDQIYYLYIMCCIKMEKLSEAEDVILSLLSKRNNENIQQQSQDYDIQSNLYYWLGIICRYTDRKQMAITNFQKALDANPFLWCAFDNLSQLGVVLDPSSIFDKTKSAMLLTKYKYSNSQYQQQNQPQQLSQNSSSSSRPVTKFDKRLSFNTSTLLSSPNPNSMSDSLLESNPLKFTGTPSSGIMTPLRDNLTTPASNLSYMSPSRFDDFSMKSPLLTTTHRTSVANSSSRRESSTSTISSVAATPSNASTPISNNLLYSTPSPLNNTTITDYTTPLGPYRKPKAKKVHDPNKKISGKLFGSSSRGSTSASEAQAMNMSISSQSSRSNSLYSPPPYPQLSQQQHQQQTTNTNNKVSSDPFSAQQTASINDAFTSGDITEKDIHNALTLLEVLGRPIQLFCQYRFQEAIAQFSKLPPKQFQTGWTYAYVGKTYSEMLQYENGEKAFEQALKLEPYRIDGLEVYSTILWHLKNKKQSSYLAHHMSELDKLAPQTLCAIGNCFSLQKDHETALKFFERATKVNKFFTYAYTLAGHEWFANDDLDEALASYRRAIKIDSRHYNAWYGIGNVYFRQEKFEQAEYHFRRAMEIHDKHSILCCYIGMTLIARKSYKEALDMLDKALRLHPQNYVAKYKRATLLVTLRQEQEALQELTSIVQFVPKEASVYFTIGKIYHRLGKKDLALLNYNIAQDLERNGQKENPFIKEQIAKLYEDSGSEDEDNQQQMDEEGYDDEFE
jgi:anaphase-promoting complex subunit 3